MVVAKDVVPGYDPHADSDERYEALERLAKDLSFEPTETLVQGLEYIAEYDQSYPARKAKDMVQSYRLAGDFSLTSEYRDALEEREEEAERQELAQARRGIELVSDFAYDPQQEDILDRIVPLVEVAMHPHDQLSPLLKEDLGRITDYDEDFSVKDLAGWILRYHTTRDRTDLLTGLDRTLSQVEGLSDYVKNRGGIPVTSIHGYDLLADRDSRISAVLAVGLSVPKKVGRELVFDIDNIKRYDEDETIRSIARKIANSYNSMGERTKRKRKIVKAIDEIMAKGEEA